MWALLIFIFLLEGVICIKEKKKKNMGSLEHTPSMGNKHPKLK